LIERSMHLESERSMSSRSHTNFSQINKTSSPRNM